MSDQDLSVPFDNERPAAELVADIFGFKLAYHDTEMGRSYSVQD